jgi:hypothetical protein
MSGVGSAIEAVLWVDGHQIHLPSSERAPTYRPILKCLIEVIFDTFLMAYINGLVAQKSYSARRARLEETDVGEMYVSGRSTNYWDQAYTRAENALTQLRLAHGHRVIDKVDADNMSFYGLHLWTEVYQSQIWIGLFSMGWTKRKTP